jgi:1,4-alpha-glucan branching enzyme
MTWTRFSARTGRWVEILNSDNAEFGGSNILTGEATAGSPGWNDLDYSATLTLPPLGVLWLAHQPETSLPAPPGTAPPGW